MLPRPAFQLADRLVTALMSLVDAVGQIAITGSTPTLPEAAAQTLFFRLTRLVTHLIRISQFGVPAAKPKPKAETREHSAPIARVPPSTPLGPGASLPRRPGWLLAALPETAPAIAAEVSTLLADPALATLLDIAPTLRRSLRSLLRGLGLGLEPAPPNPAAPTPPPVAPPPEPPKPLHRTSKPPTPTTAPKSSLPPKSSLHAQIVTMT